MILRPEVVRERLKQLHRVLRNLEEIRSIPRKEFLSSYRHYWLAERGLQLAAEAVFDIGNHLLAGHFNVHPTDHEDVTRRLAEHGVISENLQRRMQGLGGFRNILVHAYLEIDEARIHDFLQNELRTFGDFAHELEDFLERDGRRA
ncbi:MAG: DUF86 domain-containing protein [bacterium]